MSDRPLVPTAIAPPDATPAAPAPNATSDPVKPAWLALLLAVLLALAVGFGLPALMRKTPPSGDAATPAAQAEEPADPLLSPEELAAARLDAQDALAEVLAAADTLEARHAAEWNADRWRAAQALIAAGEKAYRQQRFPAAIRTYREARRVFEALNQQLPQEVAKTRAAGDAALARRSAGLAVTAYERVLDLAPGDAAALAGLKRARNLDQTDALLEQAAGYERMADTAQARSAYSAALALDPGNDAAIRALARLNEHDKTDALGTALSAGYAALAENEFGRARAAFETAAKLAPDNDEARRGLHQARDRELAARLERGLEDATRLEAAERWAEAASTLAATASLEQGLETLRPRLERARHRAALDQSLEAALRVRGDAVDSQRTKRDALAQARREPAPGPRLRRQIRELEASLADPPGMPPRT